MEKHDEIEYEELFKQGLEIQTQLDRLMEIITILEARTRTLEHEITYSVKEEIKELSQRIQTIDARTRTIEHVSNKLSQLQEYANELQLVNYIEEQLSRTDSLQKPPKNDSKSYILESLNKLASDSNDQIFPESTMEGVVRPSLFVKHCINMLGKNINVLDIGVGAGGLVYEFFNQGVSVVGIDGSNHCSENGLGYWPLLKKQLFLCDATQTFNFYTEQQEKTKLYFDLITSWECLEHISEEDVGQFLMNVSSNLTMNGFFIGSISTLPYIGEQGVVYHQTVKDKDWWTEKFLSQNLKLLSPSEHSFNERFFFRGNGPTFQDPHNYFSDPGAGFHFVAKKLI